MSLTYKRELSSVRSTPHSQFLVSEKVGWRYQNAQLQIYKARLSDQQVTPCFQFPSFRYRLWINIIFVKHRHVSIILSDYRHLAWYINKLFISLNSLIEMLAWSKGLIFPFNTAYLSILFHLPNSGAQGSGAYHSCHSVKGRIQHGQVSRLSLRGSWSTWRKHPWYAWFSVYIAFSKVRCGT